MVDVDPPDGAFEAAVEVAFLMLDVLDDLGLSTLVKTTGGKGLHIVVPIVRHVSPEQLRRAATRLTAIVANRRPDLVTAEFRKASSKGRVMLDPSRNGTGATIVAPYSPRARAEATVSFPVLPDELRSIAPGDFTVATVPDRWMRPAQRAGPKRQAIGTSACLRPSSANERLLRTARLPELIRVARRTEALRLQAKRRWSTRHQRSVLAVTRSRTEGKPAVRRWLRWRTSRRSR